MRTSALTTTRRPIYIPVRVTLTIPISRNMVSRPAAAVGAVALVRLSVLHYFSIAAELFSQLFQVALPPVLSPKNTSNKCMISRSSLSSLLWEKFICPTSLHPSKIKTVMISQMLSPRSFSNSSRPSPVKRLTNILLGVLIQRQLIV